MAGPLRIVTPKSSLLPVIWPVIDEFCRRHREVTPEAHRDDRIGNWVQDRADVGFRIGAPPEDGLIARRVFTVQLIVCAAPAYLAANGAPDTLDELATHRGGSCRSIKPGSDDEGWRLIGALKDIKAVLPDSHQPVDAARPAACQARPPGRLSTHLAPQWPASCCPMAAAMTGPANCTARAGTEGEIAPARRGGPTVIWCRP